MRHPRRSIPIAALSVALAWLLGPVTGAGAGTYRVAQCHAEFGVGPADMDFRRTSDHYRSEFACGPGNGGLTVTHEAAHTNAGRWGGWTASAPAGTELIRASAIVSGKRAGGHVPQFLVGPMSRFASVGAVAGGAHRITWQGRGAEGVRAALVCTSRDSCGPGADARIRVRRLLFDLVDSRPPRLTAAGSLFAPGSRRGLQGITATANDAGSGIHRVFVAVNGDPVAAEALDCALAGAIALRLSPCPHHAEPGFAASTAEPPFQQGTNRVRVCATDYAPDTGGSRDCVVRQVRVDNACPVSDTGGSRLRFHLRKNGRGPVDYGDRALLVGRLLDAAGGGVAGAEVCVAARTQVRGVPERVVATPTTGESGRFSVRLPAGPSRRLRVAHWPSATTVVERFRSLRVRARPRLELSPGGVLHNGERVRFRVDLPGPRAAKRHIALKVRANGRWLPLRRGATNHHGVWNGGYRFRATTGRETYRFRAFVPKQRGYPYKAGRSATKRQTVVG